MNPTETFWVIDNRDQVKDLVGVYRQWRNEKGENCQELFCETSTIVNAQRIVRALMGKE